MISLYNEDCYQFLKKLKDNSVDCVLLDPPYYMGTKPFKNKEKQYERVVEKWDNQWKTLDDYLEWCTGWLIESKRVLKPGGAILVFGIHQAHHLHVIMHKHFKMRSFITWFKPNAMPIMMAKSAGLYAHSSEFINYFTKGKTAFFDYEYLKSINNDKQMRNVIIHNNRPHSESIGHPTQKPLNLIEMLVRAHCPPGGIICDFFSGSGTTALAALMSGRHFVGTELDYDYYCASLERIDNWLRR